VLLLKSKDPEEELKVSLSLACLGNRVIQERKSADVIDDEMALIAHSTPSTGSSEALYQEKLYCFRDV